MKKNVSFFVLKFLLLFSVCRLAFLSGSAFAQTPLRSIDLMKAKPSWQAVIGGDAVSPCVETSYGIAVVSDGRLLSACTNNGNVIWQRSIKGRPSPYISSFGDFLYIVSGTSQLNFVNPSGMTLWSETCPFAIIESPLVGKDGRIFVRGEKNIACYGLNGRRKWIAETESQSSLPMGQFSDGSVIVYLSKTVNGRTVGKRFSAFGEELEDLTFSEIVSASTNCPEGILVSLRSGSIGLITVQGDKADTKWITVSGINSGAFSIAYREATRHAACFFQNGSSSQALILNVNDGKIMNKVPVGNMSASQFRSARSSSSGFFVSGNFSACEFYEDGTILWAAVLPSSKDWNQMFYTKANYLIFCMRDWSMNSFRMTQAPSSGTSTASIRTESLVKVKEMDSVSKQFSLHPLTMQKMSIIRKELQKGDMGLNEKEFLSDVKSEALSYIDTLNSRTSYRNEESYYSSDPIFTQELLFLMSQMGTSDFSSLFAKLLTSENDTLLLNSLILYAGEEGFDPRGDILNAFEQLLLNKVLPRDTTLIISICDSTYKVCRFMGRPSFNKQGKNILSRLMFPQYDKNSRDYARKTLEKMIELEK